MKKHIALFMTVALVLPMLTSCELLAPRPTERPAIEVPGTTGAAESATPTSTPAPLPTMGLTLPTFVAAEYDPRYDSDPNFVHDRDSNICVTEDTAYFGCRGAKNLELYYSLIYYLDKTSGYFGPLCGKPECLHNTSDCNAYVQSEIYALSVYDSRLYWMTYFGTGYFGAQIYSCALDGTDRRLVLELDKELLKDMGFTGVFHRGWFYVLGHYREASDADAVNHIRLIGWPLEGDGEARILFDMALGKDYPNNAIQAYGDGLYISVRAYNGGDPRLWLLRWNVATQELETFYEGEVSFTGIPGSIIISDGEFIIGVAEPVGEEAVGPWDYTESLFHFDLAEGTWKKTAVLREFGERYGEWDHPGSPRMSANLIVQTGKVGENTLAVMAQALDGTMLLDQTYQLDGIFPGGYGGYAYCGRDEANLYLYQDSGGWEGLIAVALDGSGAERLWRFEQDRGVY